MTAPVLDDTAEELAADCEWLNVSDLIALDAGTYYELDPRTVAEIDRDLWEAETRATRESDYPF